MFDNEHEKDFKMWKILKNPLIVILAGMLALGLFIATFYIMLSMPTKWDTFYVTASNGNKFRITYEANNWPDLVSELSLNYRWDKARFYFDDGWGTKDVKMDFWYENDDFAYYRIITGNKKLPESKDKSIAVISKNGPIEFFNKKSYIECIPEDWLCAEDRMVKELLPLVKYEIFEKGNLDYLINYGDEILNSDETKLIELIKISLENSDKIKCEYFTNEEIIAKCQRLLDGNFAEE